MSYLLYWTDWNIIYRKHIPDAPRRTSAAIANITTAGFRINGYSSRLKEVMKEDEAFIDSGYASAEEDPGDLENELREDDAELLSCIWNDAFEKDFTIRWLTGFIARSSIWSCPLSPPLLDEEVGEREDVIDKAASLLTNFSGTDEDEAEVALTRRFEFAVGRKSVGCGVDGLGGRLSEGKAVVVELNDEPLSSADHSSVGLQSWASSIVLAKLICADATRFGLDVGREDDRRHKQRVLELGAGDGTTQYRCCEAIQRFNMWRRWYGRRLNRRHRLSRRCTAKPQAERGDEFPSCRRQSGARHCHFVRLAVPIDRRAV